MVGQPVGQAAHGRTVEEGQRVAGAWERLAGRTGGTVAGMASATDADGTTVVFAATAIGLHRSTDGGQTWIPSSVGSIAPFVEVVAPSPNFASDKTIFVGTRNGLYRSLDGGTSWQLMLVGDRMLSIALAPSYARENQLFVGMERDGAVRSPDAGRTWNSSNAGLLDLTVMSIALSPNFDSDQTAFAATASGLYRTRNSARSWRLIDLPLVDPAVQCLGVSPDFGNDRLVLAGTEADGLLRSEDGGTSWEQVASLADQGVTAIAFSPGYPRQPTIAVATVAGIAISNDAGQTWQTTGSELGPVLSLLFVRHDDRDILLAGLPKHGIVRTEDLGVTWQAANTGLHANLLVSLVASPNFANDQTLLAAGLEDGITISSDGGTTWQEANEGLVESTVFGIAVSPTFATDRLIYAATTTGTYRSRDGAASWEPTAEGIADTASAVLVGPARGERPAPVLAALVGGILVLSDDAGLSWRTLGQAFGGAEVISLAFSPAFEQDHTIIVGTSKTVNDGTATDLILWRSNDGGERWERWLVERGQNVLPLAVPPSYLADRTVFVGLGNSIMKPVRNVEEIRSGARRPLWQGKELDEAAIAVTSIVVSPNYLNDATLFVATSGGVFVSRDGGESFTAWSEQLEPVSVVSLALAPDYATSGLVFAIGLGGTIWRRRDPRP